MGPGGAIGLNFLAVDRAMDYFHIDEDERVEFWLKVNHISSTVLNERHKEAEEERARNKKQP